jgi:hypothetical protein
LSWLHFASVAQGISASKPGTVEHDVNRSADDLDRRVARSLALSGLTQKNEPIPLSHPCIADFFDMLVEAGRLRAQVSYGVPLCPSTPRTASLQWHSPDGQHWLPAFQVEPEAILLVTTPLRYADSAGHVGHVVHDWDQDSTSVLCTIPPLSDADVATLTALSATAAEPLSHTYHKALPRFAIIDAGVVKPVVHCLLDWSADDVGFSHPSQASFLTNKEGTPVARLTFEYPFGTVKGDACTESHLVREGMVRTRYTRDLAFEGYARHRVKELCPGRLAPSSVRFTPGDWTDPRHRTECLAIQNSLQSALAPLGWNFSSSSLWPGATRFPAGYTADFGTGHDGWHQFSMTASVDGQPIDMLALLAKSFADPALVSAVTDPSVQPDTLWYFSQDDGTHLALPIRHLVPLFPLVTGLFLDSSGKYRISRLQAALLYQVELAMGVDLSSAGEFSAVISSLAPLPASLPSQTAAALSLPARPYQVHAALWCDARRAQRLGGILADEYAVGKTLQALITIFNAYHEVDGPSACSLALVDKTLLAAGRWQSDAKNFLPSLRVLELATPAACDLLSKGPLSEHLVLTTYDVLEAAVDHFNIHHWNVIVADEAHRLLNHHNVSYHVIQSLQARQKLVVTGNPYTNGPSDIWSLLNLTVPGLLPDILTFNRQYPRVREPSAPNNDEQIRYEEELLASQLKLYALGRIIAPFHLSRTNEELGRSLPHLNSEIIEVKLPEWQANLYEAARVAAQRSIADLVARYGYSVARTRILARLMLMRQMCLDPQISPVALLPENPAQPAKTAALLALLDELRAKSKKVVVTSFFTSWIDRLIPLCTHEGHACVAITGTSRSAARAAAIEQFRNGQASVLFAQTRLAQGWEAPEADVIISLDPWWNAMPERQAIARLRRDERNKTVRSIVLHAQGSLETVIRRMADMKLSQATAIRLGASTELPSLSGSDIEEILAPLGQISSPSVLHEAVTLDDE